MMKGGIAVATSVTRWDPFRDLMSIQGELNRLFGRTFSSDLDESNARGAWVPVLDVYETPEKFTLIAELPGMRAGDVDVTVEDNVLRLSGERKFYSEVNEESFHRVERRFGTFQRRITVPRQCDSSRIEASIDNGVLTIEIPKVEEAKPKKIEVKATNA